MPLDLEPELIAAKNARASTFVPIFLWELDLDDGKPVCLAKNTEDVIVNGVRYQAFPIEAAPDRQSTEGNLRRLTVTVSNITREFGELLDKENAFVGNQVRKRWVFSHELDKPKDLFEAEILEADISEDSVVFTVGDEEYIDEPFPKRRYLPGCQAVYRDPDTCGWPEPENLPEGVVDIPDCSRTYSGPNGCVAHGQAYTAAGRVPLHPRRYYAFLTIPRRRQ